MPVYSTDAIERFAKVDKVYYYWFHIVAHPTQIFGGP